jgi:uncharacterized membrane protein
METHVFLMVLGAAVIHAIWNAILKAGTDRAAAVETMFAAQGVVALCLLPIFPMPSTESFGYMLASSALGVAYMEFLQRAYRVGEFSHVYPLARGVVPLLVATISVLILGEELGTTAKLAVLLISAGIVGLSLSRGTDGLRDMRPVAWALGTSCFIASYTVIDGLGARLSGSVHGYIVWQTVIGAVLVTSATRALRQGPAAAVPVRARLAAAVAGLLGFGGAWTVVWAMTQAPLPLVAALRETSVIFAVVIGIFFFKERVRLARAASISVALLGTAVLKAVK